MPARERYEETLRRATVAGRPRPARFVGVCVWLWLSAAVSAASPAEKPDPVAAAKSEVSALEQEAIGVATRLVADFPENIDALGLLGMVYNRCGNTAKAIECWDEGVRRKPQRGDFYEAMATVALRKGEYEQAAELCRKGLKQAPKAAGLHGRLGEALNGLTRPEEAVVEFEREVERSPADPAVQFALAQTCAMLQRFAEAKKHYEAAIKLRPDVPGYYHGLATACARLGLEDEARKRSAEFQQLNAKNMEQQRNRRNLDCDVDAARGTVAFACCEAASIYAVQRNIDRAEDLLRRGMEVDARNTACRMQLAILFLSTDRESSAIWVCKELIAIEPENAEHRMYLGIVYARLRQFAAARVQAKIAVEMAPENERCRRFYKELGGE